MVTTVGGIGVDLLLETAAFRRDMAKSQALLKSESAKMRRSLKNVERASRNVSRSFSQLRGAAAALVGALAVRQFTQFTSSALSAGAAIQDVSSKVAVTAEQLQQMRFAAIQTGVGVRALDMGLQRFSRRVGEVAQGQGELLKVAQQYDIQLRRSDGTMRDNMEILQDFADVIQNAESEQERLRIAFKLFDSEGAALVNTLRDGRVGLQAFMDQAKAVGAVMTSEVIAKAKLADDNLTTLTTVFKTAFDTAIIENFADSLTLSEDKLRSVQQVGESFGKAVGASMKGLAEAAEFVGRNLREIAAAFAALIAFKMATVIGGITVAVIGFARAVVTAESAVLALTVAIARNPIGLLATLVAGAASAFILLGDNTDSASESAMAYRRALDEANDALKRANELSGTAATNAQAEAIARFKAARSLVAETLELKRNAIAREELSLRQVFPELQGNLSADLSKIDFGVMGAGQRRVAEAMLANLKDMRAGLNATVEEATALDAAIAELTESLKRNQEAQEGTAGATKKATTTFEDGIKSLERQVTLLRLTEMGHLEMAKAVERQFEAEDLIQRLQKAGVTLDRQQERRIRDLIAVRDDLTETIRRQEKAERDAESAAKEAAQEAARRHEEAKQRAREARELFLQPFKNAIDGIQSAFSDMFEGIFSGGVDSFSDLANTVKRIFIKLAAEIAALLVFRPVVGSVLGGIGLGGIGSMLTGSGGAGGSILGSIGNFNPFSFDPRMFGSSLGGLLSQPIGLTLAGESLATIGPSGVIGPAVSPGFGLGGISAGTLLGAAGLGAFGGGLLAQLTGGNQLGGTIGGGLGAAAGAAIGSIIPGIGTVLGGIIGGAGGGLLGGLFGGGESVGPNAAAQINLNSATGRISLGVTGADNGGNVQAVTQAANQLIQGLNNLADQFDLRIGLGGLGGQFAITSGNVGGFQSPAEFVNALLASGGLTSANGDEIIDQVLRQSTAANVQQNLSDLTALLDIIEGLDAPALTQAGQAIEAINARFDELTDKAIEFGVATEQLEEARLESLTALTEGFDEQVSRQILAITDPLQAALDALAEAQEQRLREAEALGADTAALSQLNQLELQQLRDRFASTSSVPNFRQQGVDAAKSIVDFLRAQSLDAGSTLSPAERLIESQRQFRDLLERARGGETGLTGSLTQSAQTLLGFARQNFASTVDFANIERFVRSSLTNLASDFLSTEFADRQADAFIEGLSQQSQADQENTAEIVSAIDSLKREIQLLRQDLAA